jgi:hypothetical protein
MDVLLATNEQEQERIRGPWGAGAPIFFFLFFVF